MRTAQEAQAFYATRQWKEMAALVAAQDGWTCRACGMRGFDLLSLERRTLNVHHIRPLRAYWAMALETSNLVTLCRRCHDRHHRGGRKGRIHGSTRAEVLSWLESREEQRRTLSKDYRRLRSYWAEWASAKRCGSPETARLRDRALVERDRLALLSRPPAIPWDGTIKQCPPGGKAPSQQWRCR